MKDWLTVVVDSAGVASLADLRAQHEGARIDAVLASGHVPDGTCSDIPVAPARGAVRLVDGREMRATDAGGFVRVRTGHKGRKTMVRADNFDVMFERARARGKSAPFTASQVAMGRQYRDLVERWMSAGVKCSSVEALSSGGGGDGGGFMDAVLADRQRIDMLRRRIGDGVAREVRRNRPSRRGSRKSITDRRLVDMVCLEGCSLSDVLQRHGWAVNAKLVADLRASLSRALDRMQGRRLRRDILTMRDGDCDLRWPSDENSC